jgi:2-polyprenyl-3-methyl-5-hydroxy-6-metoxy-1,4-benzoquinol methylase
MNPDYVSEAQAVAIRAVPHFAEGAYRDLNCNLTIDFYVRRYVNTLAAFLKLGSQDTVADVGAGYGWLSIAFALSTDAHISAIDSDEQRLDAARQIAEILGVADRIDWRVGQLGSLPLVDREARVAFCIEVLEHTGRRRTAIRDLGRISSDALVITTPNLYFPVIAHDTQLPFCHWLPMPARREYARIFLRTNCENHNLFWSASELLHELPEFRVVSGFLHYASLADYRSTFPFYLPYGAGEMRYRDGRIKSAYYAVAQCLGRRALYVMPNLASTFRRIHQT